MKTAVENVEELLHSVDVCVVDVTVSLTCGESRGQGGCGHYRWCYPSLIEFLSLLWLVRLLTHMAVSAALFFGRGHWHLHMNVAISI